MATEGRVHIRQPAILSGVAIAATAAFAAAGFGLLQLHDARTAPQGAVIAEAAADGVAEALAAAPWVASAPGSGPVVWAVAPLDCGAPCDRFHSDTVASLAASGAPVRVVAYAAADGAKAAAAAGLAKARTWDAYRAILAEKGEGPAMAPDEAEGLALWARASAERLADQGVPLDQPAVLWRTSTGWRVLSGEDALEAGKARSAMNADLAALRG